MLHLCHLRIISTMNFKKRSGFTLIELLVVISIISLLASIILASLNVARLRAYDARRVEDFHSISNALAMFYYQYGKYPASYVCGADSNSTSFCADGTGNWGACDAVVPGLVGADPSIGPSTNLVLAAWNASMNELVQAKFLGSIPHSPGGGPGYCYMNFGSGNERGAVILTAMQVSQPTGVRTAPSCQFDGNEWCATNQPLQYCLCHPY